MKTFKFLFAFVLVTLAVACSGGSGGGPITPSPKPTVDKFVVAPNSDGTAACEVVVANLNPSTHYALITVSPMPAQAPTGRPTARISCGPQPVIKVQWCTAEISCTEATPLVFSSTVTYVIAVEIHENAPPFTIVDSKSVTFSGAQTGG